MIKPQLTIQGLSRTKQLWFCFGFLLLLAPAGPAFGKTTFHSMSVKVLDCYDGDTCTIDVRGMPRKFAVLGKGLKVRLLGLDTPEMEGLCRRESDLAKEARSRLLHKIRKGKQIRLKLASFLDVYHRHLGKLYVDGQDIAPYMLRQRHKGYPLAHKKRGKDRHSWCR